MNNEEIIIEVEERESYCMACDGPIKHASILICNECMGEDCDDFFDKIAELEDEHV